MALAAFGSAPWERSQVASLSSWMTVLIEMSVMVH